MQSLVVSIWSDSARERDDSLVLHGPITTKVEVVVSHGQGKLESWEGPGQSDLYNNVMQEIIIKTEWKQTKENNTAAAVALAVTPGRVIILTSSGVSITVTGIWRAVAERKAELRG